MASITVYIPSESIYAWGWTQRITRELCRLFGGATVTTRGTGNYVMDDLSLCTEPVTVLLSYTRDSARMDQALTELVPLFGYMATDLGQETVGYAVEYASTLHFVKGT